MEQGYRWINEEGEPLLAKDDIRIEPVSKVFKRLKNGSEDNVYSFYDIMMKVAKEGVENL